VYHLSEHDGWTVNPVVFAPPSESGQGSPDPALEEAEPRQQVLLRSEFESRFTNYGLQRDPVCSDRYLSDRTEMAWRGWQEAISAIAVGPQAEPRPPADWLNRRAEVEQQLFDVANGKRTLPTAVECREWALRLGVPSDANFVRAGAVRSMTAAALGAPAPETATSSSMNGGARTA